MKLHTGMYVACIDVHNTHVRQSKMKDGYVATDWVRQFRVVIFDILVQFGVITCFIDPGGVDDFMTM